MTQMPRKQGLYRTKRRADDYGQNNENDERNQNNRDGNPAADNLIVDMAKGFVEAQAKISSTNEATTNREVLQLLQKISSQLDNVQKANSSNSNNQPDDSVNQQQNKESGNNLAAMSENKDKSQKELHNLFSQLLSAAKQDTPQQQQKTTGEQSQKPQAASAEKQQNLSPQSAAQALSQAQYELSQELDASLQKLKQVIAESEKLATRISNIIENDKDK